jgi:hypothetical protein
MLVFGMAFVTNDALAKKNNVVRAPGGTSITSAGISVDASYDPRFDSLLPGYKVVNVALVNESFNIIGLDPERDEWSIVLEGDKREHKALNNLRSQNPKAWASLPEKVKGLIAYPLVLPIGGKLAIDLFVPDSVDVVRFNELDIYLRSIDTKFEILVRQ